MSTRKAGRRSEAEIRAEIALVELEIDMADRKRRERLRQGCPAAWARVDAENPVSPRKVSVTLRLDRDVARWFWQQGQGYQSRINAVLRAYMLAKQAEVV